MDQSTPSLPQLFARLGLANDELSIARFICSHSLNAQTMLPEASFWSPPQAEFLRESLWLDNEWSLAIDELDRRLRHMR